MQSAMATPPHFLLIPLPEHGHITPMLSLASHLAALGCTVTFLVAEKAPLIPIAAAHNVASDVTNVQHSIGNANGASHMPFATNLHFQTLPHTGGPYTLPEGSSLFDILKQTLAGLDGRQGMVELMVRESKLSRAPIACIICDILLCSWVMPLATRQAILSTVLVPVSFASFCLSYPMQGEKSEEAERLKLSVGLPSQRMALSMSEERFEEVKRVFWGAQKHVEQSSYVLVNSCEGLETEALCELAALNVRFIGPCFPAWEMNDEAGRNGVGAGMAKKAGCPFDEDASCLPWLDGQEKNSVLLVSFGSEVTLEAEQVQELAMGIEASGCKFLWVVRPDAQVPPKDFLDRTRDVGMCVRWSPQRRVLQHNAVGGFLTHCGWNSTMESILFGVPMLCLPLNGDQFVNAHMVHSHWKVGLQLGPPNTVVPRAMVDQRVRELMSSDELRLRMGVLQGKVHSAWLASQNSISSFVQEVGNCSSRQRLVAIVGVVATQL